MALKNVRRLASNLLFIKQIEMIERKDQWMSSKFSAPKRVIVFSSTSHAEEGPSGISSFSFWVSTPYWNKHLCKTGVVSSNNDGEKKRCQKHFVQNDSKGWIFYHEQWWMNRPWVLLKHLQLTHQWYIYRELQFDWFRYLPTRYSTSHFSPIIA